MASFVFSLFLLCGLVLFAFSFNSVNTPSAKDNMESLSSAQLKLYRALSFHGYTVSIAYPCGRYTLELAIPKYRIAISCPGKVVNFPTPKQKSYELKRERYLANQGWTVLKVPGTLVQGKMNLVIKQLEEKIKEIQVI